MAGGKFAQFVPCSVCMEQRLLTKATRVREGVEDDQYRCERGHTFGLDWSKGPATELQWPVPQELADALKG
ncbi:hypothetical protein BH11MYX1_BH11MYX1_07720 [soil metagenome]